jgi:hypothetical protein
MKEVNENGKETIGEALKLILDAFNKEDPSL